MLLSHIASFSFGYGCSNVVCPVLPELAFCDAPQLDISARCVVLACSTIAHTLRISLLRRVSATQRLGGCLAEAGVVQGNGGGDAAARQQAVVSCVDHGALCGPVWSACVLRLLYNGSSALDFRVEEHQNGAVEDLVQES